MRAHVAHVGQNFWPVVVLIKQLDAHFDCWATVLVNYFYSQLLIMFEFKILSIC